MNRRPSTKTLIMGHPLVATPMTLACGVMTFAGIWRSDLAAVLVSLPIGLAVLRASEQAANYRAWAREWEAMEPGGPRRRNGPFRWLALIAIVLGTLVLVGSDGATQRQAAMWVGLPLGGLATFVLIWTVLRWIIHHRRGRIGPPVVQIVARPVAAVPSLADAYRALPAHCHALLKGEQGWSLCNP